MKDLLKTPVDTPQKALILSETMQRLTKPAPADWVQGEVAKVLIHYHADKITPEIASSLGADYGFHLKDYPAWAIAKARLAWLGANNPHRYRKPLPGDIAEGAKLAMQEAGIYLAKGRLYEWEKSQ